MKKRGILFLFILPSVLFAQQIVVSEDIPLRNDAAYELIGELKGNMLLFRDQNFTYEVQGFNDQMRMTWTKDIELDKRSPKVLGIATSKEDFTVFYRFRDKGNTILKAHKYDPAANLIDSVTIYDFGFLFFTPGFEIIRSEDRSKALIYYIEKQETLRAFSYDVDSMHLLWDKSIPLEDFSYNQDFQQMMVDNAGNMHMILSRDNFRSRRKPHHYEVIEYNGGSAQFNNYRVSMENRLTYDVYFNYDNLNKKLVAGGLYSEKNPERALGLFYLNVDPKNPKDRTLKFLEFDTEFISNVKGKEVDKNKGLTELSVQEIVLRRDGGILLIAEQNRHLERLGGNSGRFYDSGRFNTDYYYDELFVVSIHPDGQEHWKTILHKKQYSQDDEGMYSSYFLFKTPSNLRFLFNDEIRPENTVSEYVVNGRGDFDRNSLLSTENLELRLRFRDAIQVDANRIVIPSERRNRLKLVRLEY
ncbi:MAG: hypothetical protein DHS20C18_01000 [Saprospiraceae bacterium]|nr:MAG: hypothetical protein DHS20C18_01000 [Saprospiraceae bacterium]